ncbi:hypothetical protein A3849_28430 [Paenibacillus sp. P46E]|nr:hypothetical protein A3849_28430 [Paenibacillus sp. P46E]
MIAVEFLNFGIITLVMEKGLATNALKSGDDAVLNNSISNIYKASVKIGNSNAAIEYTTTVVYSASSNTVVYLVNNQIVQTVVVNVTQGLTQNAKQTYTKANNCSTSSERLKYLIS